MEHCANCAEIIDNADTPFVFRDRTVCAGCHAKLKKSADVKAKARIGIALFLVFGLGSCTYALFSPYSDTSAVATAKDLALRHFASARTSKWTWHDATLLESSGDWRLVYVSMDFEWVDGHTIRGYDLVVFVVKGMSDQYAANFVQDYDHPPTEQEITNAKMLGGWPRGLGR